MNRNQLKHISNLELLNELEKRKRNQLINRKELLQLAGITWCLECSSNRETQANGYCEDCNNRWVEEKEPGDEGGRIIPK